MPLAELSKQKLLSFIGYGPNSPRFIFVGSEEARTGDAMTNILARVSSFEFPRHDSFTALKQLAAAYAAATYKGAAKHAHAYAAEAAPGNIPAWKFAAMVTAALRDPAECVTDGAWRQDWPAEYKKLGTREGDTLLTDLFPLPKKGLKEWPPDYTTEFGFTSSSNYYGRFWPRNAARPSARREILRSVVEPSAPALFVIGYGRGSNREFWDRFSQLFCMTKSTIVASGEPAEWHEVVEDIIEVGLTTRGTRVARTGFPWGRGEKPIEDAHVPALVNALRALQPARAEPLPGSATG